MTGTLVHITKDNFDAEVAKSKKPVVVDFWAEWCGPCRLLGPVFEALSGEVTDVKFAKLNVDENQELSSQYGVMSIPTIVLFKNGEEVDRAVGALGKEQLKKWIASNK